MCISFPSRKPGRKPGRRPVRMPTFGPRKHPLHTLQHLVDVATLISPTQGGFHKPAPATKIPSEEGTTLGSISSTDTNGVPKNTAAGTGAHKLLVLTPAITGHLRRVYDALRGRKTTLSREQLVRFLKETQGELALELLHTREELTFEQFLEVWSFQYGWDAVRPLSEDEKDITRPISNYFINSSHNTYLSGNQLTSPSSAEAYRKVLNRNCRCIEIDVWNGDDSGSHTPARSKSPMPTNKSRLSSSSLPKLGIEVSKAGEKKYDTIKHLWSGKPTPSQSRSHSRNPSTNEPAAPPTVSARGSVQSLDLKDLGERLRRTRASTNASKYSSAICEPIVMHGWTLTSPVGFREVCVAIRETSFKTNPLPIIVSLEVHADMEQQEVMVEIMKEEWAGILLDRAHEECAPHQRQPRLEELLNKILIKVKKPPARGSVPNGTNLAVVATPYDDDLSGSEDERDHPSGKKQQQRNNIKVPICESLAALAVYTHSSHFQSFDVPAAKTFGHIFSISEARILELHASRRREMFAHNRNFFMRAFPNGRRVDSSNPPDPSLFWRKGVQMVALNWQCWDEGMALNDAMFAGSEGWVLKPRGYRSGDARSTTQVDAVAHRTLDLKLTFYAGQHIPLPEARQKGDANTGAAVGAGSGSKRFRPYVKVDLLVERPEERTGKLIEVEAKARDGQYKMKTEPGETENPDWGKNGDCLNFPGVRMVVEELSFVRFKIEDDSSYFRGSTAAWACVRLDRLRPGYRLIDLLDARGKLSAGKLLVKIEKAVR